MRIGFIVPDGLELDSLASYRYRIMLPAYELISRHEVFIGEPTGRDNLDVAIVAKHHQGLLEMAARVRCPIIFDVCNDHWDKPGPMGDVYRKLGQTANVLTCNSAAMAQNIFMRTERSATVIPDPYEHAEWRPEFNPANPPRLVWFGHHMNHDTLTDLPIPGTLEVLSDVELKVPSEKVKWTMFSRPEMVRAVREADIVVIPTLLNKRTASANRVIESLRLGKFVVAGAHVQAYEEFAEFIWIGDLLDGMKWAYMHQAEVLDKILRGQAYVRANFSPNAVSWLWEAACESAINGSTNNRLAQERA